MIPFSNEVYFSLFADLNPALWPAHLVAYGFALLIVVLATKNWAIRDRLIPVIMAGGWFWIGLIFFDQALASVLWAAWIFKAAFWAQAGLLAGIACLPKPIPIRLLTDNRSWTAGLFFMVCTIFYPLLAAQWGHAWPNAQLLGIAPLPTVVFTIGVLNIAPSKPGRILVILPACFALISLLLAWNLGIWEDVLLAFLGLFGVTRIFAGSRDAGPLSSTGAT